MAFNRFGGHRQRVIQGAIGDETDAATSQALQGLNRAGERPDLQIPGEAAGLTDERFRQIANMGPEFDARVGGAPNPAGRRDLPPSAFRQHMLFEGLDGADVTNSAEQPIGMPPRPFPLGALAGLYGAK